MQRKLSDDPATTAEHLLGHQTPARRMVPALTVVSHPDAERIGERLLLEVLSTSGRTAALSRNAPEFSQPDGQEARPLGDLFLSRTPIEFDPGARGRLRLRVPEDGTTVRVEEEPLWGIWEFTPEQLVAGVPLVLAERVVLLLHLAQLPEAPSVDTLGMVGHSASLRQVREDVLRVADLNVPVLLRGETGTGKELVAKAIHQHSARRDGPFLSVNLSAISKDLASSELFGAQRGAFTGALRDRPGLFRAAHGGTLFLDEVGEASHEVQVALLRVLETGEVYPVGGSTPVPIDVRLITATDANLEDRIKRELFRAPLLHRLAGFELRLPPLRERREDIGALFLHFARQELEATGESHHLRQADPRALPWLSASLAVQLLRYSWPGNIRQLRNVTRQLVIGSRGLSQLRLDARLEQELGSAVTPLPGRPQRVRSRSALAEPEPPVANLEDTAEPDEALSPRRKPAEVDEQELLQALRDSAWDLKAAAERLGISRASVYLLIDKSSLLRTAGDLSAEEITRCFHECQGDVDKMVQRLEVSRRALLRRLREMGLVGA